MFNNVEGNSVKKNPMGFGSNVRSKIKTIVLEMLQKIGLKLFIGLLIPVLLLGIYGVLSYRKSQEAIINNYIYNAADAIKATSDYLSFGLDMVKQNSMDLTLDENVIEFYKNKKPADDVTSIKLKGDIEQNLRLDTSTNSFIAAIHIFVDNQNSVSSFNTVNKDIYTSFMESEQGKLFEDRSLYYYWTGDHHTIDEALSTDRDRYTSDRYALSIIRKYGNGKGFVTIDISSHKIKEMFADYDLGKGCIMGLVTGDGKETLYNTEETSVFTNTSFYNKAVEGESKSGNSFEKYNGKDYLYLYEKVEGINAIICALIPKTTVLEQVSGIKTLSITFVTIACIIAILTVTIIARGISGAIASLRKSILQAATGDLTTEFTTKRKDEFRILSNGISNMINDMRKLILEVQEVGSIVSDSAGNLTQTCEDMLRGTKDITQTIENTQQGIVQQAGDTEQCLIQMTGLSEQISNLSENTKEIENIAISTQNIAGEGIVIVDELNEKSKETYTITQSVINKIEEFEVQSKNIYGMVNLINNIASQTNLLSLNASIEAARAGEAGRGFAVVAEEIRKLADQTMQAARQIQNTVKEIQTRTKETVEAAKDAETIVESQTLSLERTVSAFNNINHHVQELVNYLNHISDGIQAIDTAKDDTLLSIESISAVSEQSAAAAEEMSATASNQLDAVENLRLASLELDKNSKKLEDAIKKFKLN